MTPRIHHHHHHGFFEDGSIVVQCDCHGAPCNTGHLASVPVGDGFVADATWKENRSSENADSHSWRLAARAEHSTNESTKCPTKEGVLSDVSSDDLRSRRASPRSSHVTTKYTRKRQRRKLAQEFHFPVGASSFSSSVCNLPTKHLFLGLHSIVTFSTKLFLCYSLCLQWGNSSNSLAVDAMMISFRPKHFKAIRKNDDGFKGSCRLSSPVGYGTHSQTTSFATMAASKVNASVSFQSEGNGYSSKRAMLNDHDDEENISSASNVNRNGFKTGTSGSTPIPFDAWLDRTTARLLNMPPPNQSTTIDRGGGRSGTSHSPFSQYHTSSASPGYIPLGELTVDDVQLITTLMSSHARRGTVESALTCEQLLKRVVEDVNAGNRSVRVTTKMYTVAMDAWAKSQRRPLPGSMNPISEEAGARGKNQRQQIPLQLHPQQQLQQANNNPSKQGTQPMQLPLGAAAQRAHRIHNSLVQAYKLTADPHLAPSTVSYNAAINAWSKSYHPSAGEMAELLLGEMMREWRFGESPDIIHDEEDDNDVEMSMEDWSEENDDEGDGDGDYKDDSKAPADTATRGNDRVRPDVVTFTAVIDAWVKCTALAHDYHYEQPPPNPHLYSSNYTVTKFRKEKENYVEWKRNQAEKADALTRRAAIRAKQLLNLMIQLSHVHPGRQESSTTSLNSDNIPSSSFPKCEPCMRPNCYTYSAVMNALAKSCSALRAASPAGAGGSPTVYDPAKEAQEMLESMIEKYERYKNRVGEPETWKSVGYRKRFENQDSSHDGPLSTEQQDGMNNNDSGKYNSWLDSSWATANQYHYVSPNQSEDKFPSPHVKDPQWFDPRPDEITFPPNTINYNSVLNAWSRASRYDSYAALRAEQILLHRMERPQSEGGDAVEPDALSYSLVIHAWLRGCRGSNGAIRDSASSITSGRSTGSDSRKVQFTDQERIERALGIVDKMEAWARSNYLRKWKEDGNDDNARDEDASAPYSAEIMDDLDDSGNEVDDETEETTMDRISDEDVDGPQSNSFRQSTRSSSPPFRLHNKARDLDAEVYNSILVAYSREQMGDHAASVMRLLDRMESVAVELDMPSVRPNLRSYNVALDVISKTATRSNSSLAAYYDNEETTETRAKNAFNPLYAGRAAESILSRMLARDFRPDAYTFASVLNTYQRIPNGRLDAALAADGVVRGMESLHLHGRVDDPPDVFHYTMVCACWSRSGEQGVAGERCSQILRHMHERDKAGFPRSRPNIRTYNAVIDAHAHNGRLLEAEDMLRSMVDAYESSAARSMDGIEDEELPVRPDSFSFNTVIQQWARSRSPEGGRRAESILERLIQFHNNGNADVRPDERSFAYVIHHYTKGSGRMAPDAPDRALMLLRKMISMYWQGYKEVLPPNSNRTNPIFAFTSVIGEILLHRFDIPSYS
eukprot:CCRYP_012839-RA/>CCRYP_012839-RA protein AED:0.08 eAED:0.08 QI:268/1/1/1/0.71/0.5/8/3023/1411